MTDNSPGITNPYIWNPDTSFTPIGEMDAQTAESQTELLQEAVREHDRRYYIEDNPIIADRTYDALFARLKELEEEFNLVTEDSPTQRVGGDPIEDFPTVEHTSPMLSIEQSGEVPEVRGFHSRVSRETRLDPVEYVCEPKFDGISLALYYEDGVLDKAVTRGDGQEGDDVTQNARTVQSIPLRLQGDPPEFLVVRGELFMPRDGFQEYNRERIENDEDPFANPRNATAGTIRQQDPEIVDRRPLAFYAFEVLETSSPWNSRLSEHESFKKLGLPVSSLVESATGIDEAIEYRDTLLEKRDDLNVAIDGVVIKVNNRDAQETLGKTSHHPRWAFAYKFPPRSEETTLRDVGLQIGRTGRVTPVALLDPVDVGGVTVSRASLHNPEQIASLGADIGDKVRVERAGDVIPQVAEVIDSQSDSHFTFPDTCTVCGSQLERDGPMARCTGGLSCASQKRRSIEHYTSRKGLDIDGFGEQTVKQLLEAGLINDISDLYTLDVESIAELDGFGERSAIQLVESIDATQTPELRDFITALGIREVGPTVARSLAIEFETFANLRNATQGELKAVDDIGPVTVERIHDFFDSPGNKDVLKHLLSHVSPQPCKIDPGDEFEGMTIVFTGSLPSYSRGEASELIEREGGNVTSSVSGATDLLVVGENPGQRKQEQAEDNDVETIDGPSFEQQLSDIE